MKLQEKTNTYALLNRRWILFLRRWRFIVGRVAVLGAAAPRGGGGGGRATPHFLLVTEH